MPKLNNRPPKYCKMGNQALVYLHGKKIYLGLHGSPESKVKYSRLLADLQASPNGLLPEGEKKVTVRELAVAFLDYAKTNVNSTDYTHYRTVILDFLDKLYGDDFPVDNFKPRCLKPWWLPIIALQDSLTIRGSSRCDLRVPQPLPVYRVPLAHQDDAMSVPPNRNWGSA